MSLDLLDLIRSKAIQSKQDQRLATVLQVADEFVVMDIERVGKRVFPIQVVEQGFILHLDNTSLIKGFVAREIRTDIKLTDKQVYQVACDTKELMGRRFPDMTYLECYKAIRSLYQSE